MNARFICSISIVYTSDEQIKSIQLEKEKIDSAQSLKCQCVVFEKFKQSIKFDGK